MSRINCPECLTESGVEIERTLLESGLEKTFECEDCGHVWSVLF
ncbi:hypothetical protein [Natrinema sp. 1APR25-10V2]|nr:hypothetical protein [Natrinema sp. 1APR25-10V2]